MTDIRRQSLRRRPPLGQHFLRDSAARARIVEALGQISQAAVVEIGPGKGALTRRLATRCRRLTAVELDRGLAAALEREFAGNPAVEVVHGDILRLDLADIAAQAGQRLQVVGNLPYAITSRILLHLFRHADAVDQAVLMVQREVAERLAAEPGGRQYGLLSATACMHARVECLFTLPPGAFSPPPAVDSAVVRLVMRSRFAELRVTREAFLEFLRSIFSHKRKTLANNLSAAGFSSSFIQGSMRECGLDTMIRAESLPVERVAELYRALQSERQSGTGPDA